MKHSLIRLKKLKLFFHNCWFFSPLLIFMSRLHFPFQHCHQPVHTMNVSRRCLTDYWDIFVFELPIKCISIVSHLEGFSRYALFPAPAPVLSYDYSATRGSLRRLGNHGKCSSSPQELSPWATFGLWHNREAPNELTFPATIGPIPG